MQLERFHPSPILAPYIKEYLIIEGEREFVNTIIPNAFFVLSFRYQGLVFDGGIESAEALPFSVIAGLRKTVRHVRYTKGTANLLVIFQTGGIAAFSRIGAHEFFGCNIPAENLFNGPELSEVADRLALAASNERRAAIVDGFLQDNLKGRQRDPAIEEAIHWIDAHNGMVRIKDLAAALYISQDAFEKRFRTRIGATPRQYASVIRLRKLIDNYPTFSSLTEASYEAGYFDQSHFIKDFRSFTGQTPSDFFKTSRYW